MPHIDFEVDLSTGKVEIEGHQFTGGACKAAIAPYLKKLGIVETQRVKSEQATIVRKIEQKL